MRSADAENLGYRCPHSGPVSIFLTDKHPPVASTELRKPSPGPSVTVAGTALSLGNTQDGGRHPRLHSCRRPGGPGVALAGPGPGPGPEPVTDHFWLEQLIRVPGRGGKLADQSIKNSDSVEHWQAPAATYAASGVYSVRPLHADH
jgi:hypothetical protein